MPRAMIPNSGMKANMFDDVLDRDERRLEVGQHDPGADEQRDRDDLGARQDLLPHPARRVVTARRGAHATRPRHRGLGRVTMIRVDQRRGRADLIGRAHCEVSSMYVSAVDAS